MLDHELVGILHVVERPAGVVLAQILDEDPVVVAELDAEGVLDGLGGGAVPAARVAHEDEDVFGAVGAELDELDGALLLLPEGLVVVLGPGGEREGGGRGGDPAAGGGELPGVVLILQATIK